MLEELKMLLHNLFCHQVYAIFRFLAYVTRWRWSIKFAILVHESTAPEDVPQWIKDLVPEEFIENCGVQLKDSPSWWPALWLFILWCLFGALVVLAPFVDQTP